MNAVEKLLRDGLERDPADWAVRLELAGKLAERGDREEAARIVGAAPAPPLSGGDLQRALSLLGGRDPSTLGWFQTPQIEAAPVPGAVSAEEPKPQVTKAIEVEAAAPVTTMRPLSPPEPKAVEASPTPAEPKPKPVELAAPEPRPVTVEPEPLSEPAAVVVGEEPALADLDGIDSEQVVGEGRAFIVGDGEMIHAHDKEPDAGKKVTALTMAVLVHGAIIAALMAIAIASPRPKPPQLTATSTVSNDTNEIEQEKIQKVQRRPSQSAAAQMEIVSSVAVSPVSMPEITTNNLTFDPIGVGDTFGSSMNFTDADGAGMVSFFGSRTKAQKVVFVVDASASMKSAGVTGKTKFELMKEELTKSVEALPTTVEVQILFFSGPVWVCGEDENRKDWNEWVQNGKKLNFWQYKDGDESKLPDVKYVQATKSNIRKMVKGIEETKMSGGTDWRDPLKIAMKMSPDVIYFMTDGAVGIHPEKPPVVDDVLKFNKSMNNARINTICLMVPKAVDDLKALADKTKGEFTLVLEDGTPVRGRELDRMGK